MLLLQIPEQGLAQTAPDGGDRPVYERMDLFPLQGLHTHGSTVAVLPNGDVLAAWFQGSGERWADDVVINGARLKAGANQWSQPFLMADVPDFPDINPVLFVDRQDRLWLAWYTVMANQWETSLLKYRISTDYLGEGAPTWEWQDVLHVKPGDRSERGIQPGDRFVAAVEAKLNDYEVHLEETRTLDHAEARTRWQALETRTMDRARGEDMVRSGRLYAADGSYVPQDLGYAYFQRMGWQTRNKPALLGDGRIILPLYSDGFSFSLMAITDDGGKTWSFSEPLVAPGSIQPALVQRRDGALVAYMRDNGPAPKRLHVSTSADGGVTWSGLRDSELPNPGSGADVAVLPNGHWALVYNDTEQGRHSLAVSISADEGRSWPWTRHIERAAPDSAQSHYPAVVVDGGGTMHVVYSFFSNTSSPQQKNIRYARLNEAWVREGDR